MIHLSAIMNKAILLFCPVVSCVIIMGIMYLFWDKRYTKSYSGQFLYIVIFFINIITVSLVNRLINPVAGLVLNVLWVGVVSCFFYRKNSSERSLWILESEILFVVIKLSEILVIYLIWHIFQMMGIVPEITKNYYYFKGNWTVLFSFLIVVHLLHFIKCLDERADYKMQIAMMEQQEKLQYENYKLQQEKYAKSISALHDIKKHISIIEELYQDDQRNEAVLYTEQFNDMLHSLAPIHFVNNPIMNCLLSDKIRMAEKMGIVFKIEIATVDIDFMQPMDITTLFGNLFDNAINSCKKCKGEKYIGFYMQNYNEMLSIRVENSVSEPVPIKNGRIMNTQSGIGLLNIYRCINNYNGSIIYKSRDKALICDILLNESDVL